MVNPQTNPKIKRTETGLFFRIGIFFWWIGSSFCIHAQNTEVLSGPIQSDTVHIRHTYTIGPLVTLSGPGSILYATLVYGGGVQQTYILRKNNHPRFFADLIIAYLVRNNFFSVQWNDLESMMYQAYQYIWQASAGWNVNHQRGKGHMMYMGPFMTGKIYDSHINRNQYTIGCFFADDVKIKSSRIPFSIIYKMHIPVLDYTESLRTPLFLSKYILNWQYSLGIGYQITKDQFTYLVRRKRQQDSNELRMIH